MLRSVHSHIRRHIDLTHEVGFCGLKQLLFGSSTDLGVYRLQRVSIAYIRADYPSARRVSDSKDDSDIPGEMVPVRTWFTSMLGARIYYVLKAKGVELRRSIPEMHINCPRAQS
jgi:hypothetical protein